MVPFSGCKERTYQIERANKDNIKVGFVYNGSIEDKGYTQAHDKGRLALIAMGIKTAYIINVDDTNSLSCDEAIRKLIEKLKCNVIFTTSYGFIDSTKKMALEYPDVIFYHCSSSISNTNNLGSYFGKIYQSRYLAGMVAGLHTKSNQIGYVAAFPIPECIRGINAFTLGAQAVNPQVQVKVRWSNTWYNPSLEKEIALELIDSGCDVMTQHQNSTATLVASEERGVYCLGYSYSSSVDAPKTYLTAPIFNWAIYYTSAVNGIMDGVYQPEFYWGDISTCLVGLDKFTLNCKAGTSEIVNPVMSKLMNNAFEPFTGPLYDQSGILKVEEGQVMTREDIWSMSWFVQGVDGRLN
ncbi:MAG: BMP family ABC transporter substrate-binding protein [Treponema sp.]|nr:BMP family ABC transporter substrate-binding protein [Treponema sp.]